MSSVKTRIEVLEGKIGGRGDGCIRCRQRGAIVDLADLAGQSTFSGDDVWDAQGRCRTCGNEAMWITFTSPMRREAAKLGKGACDAK